MDVLGSGCGSVGRAVASDTRDPRFESSHRQIYIYILNICLLCIEKMKIKKKRPGMAHLKIHSIVGSNPIPIKVETVKLNYTSTHRHRHCRRVWQKYIYVKQNTNRLFSGPVAIE